MLQVQSQPDDKANWESVSRLWRFAVQAWEALIVINILCDAKFQQSVN